jgi:hypothetical protein
MGGGGGMNTNSYATKIDSNINPAIFHLSGPAAVRAQFFPKQRISIIEAGKIIGIGYHQLWKLNKSNRLRLKIRTCDAGRSYVLVDDLIEYLFSPTNDDGEKTDTASKKKLGRPRKSTEGGAR